MTRRQTDKYPIFRALGSKHEFLDAESSIAADRDVRIRSIWPFIVRKAKRFHQSLKPREQVNFDPEDIATELWVALAKKDHQWNPDRGRYITFAGTIIARELCEIRDKARTIESPRNSSCRMKEYIEEESAGTISPRRKKTADDIRRSGDGATAIVGDRGDANLSEPEDGDPSRILSHGEAVFESLEALRLAISSLTPTEAMILGRIMGLWGRARQTAFWVAWDTMQDVSDVRRAKIAAFAKLRRHLHAINHPVTKHYA